MNINQSIMQNRPKFMGIRATGGFSLIEIVVVSLVVSLILMLMQNIFSSGIKQSVKGTGLLMTIKEASDLFGAVKKDLLASLDVTVKDSSGNSILRMISAADTFPDASSITFGSEIVFKLSETSTATFKMLALPNSKYCVTRVFQKKNQPDKISKFAVPKMKTFRSLMLLQEQMLADSPFLSRHLFVEIVLQDDDPRSSNKPIRLAFFLSPLNLGLSNWNFSFSK
ncbi:MAG: hypothetical protein HQM10_13395 [Candidatus Riflebacteria bacterium]|nr:hypothetical protein [Candidatus Riflebacteria bacterium]